MIQKCDKTIKRQYCSWCEPFDTPNWLCCEYGSVSSLILKCQINEWKCEAKRRPSRTKRQMSAFPIPTTMKSSLVKLPPEILSEIVNHLAEQKDTLTLRPFRFPPSKTDMMTVEHPIAPLRRCVTPIYQEHQHP